MTVFSTIHLVKPSWLIETIFLISTIMMETYWPMLAELVSEIYFAVGTHIYTKSNQDTLTRKKLSLIFVRN